jgi:hypothetical protein
MMDKVRKPSNSECYIQSSESFKKVTPLYIYIYVIKTGDKDSNYARTTTTIFVHALNNRDCGTCWEICGINFTISLCALL